MLPILTFDEARLSPSHGYLFNRGWLCPHETILGIAWKFAHMNALPGYTVVKQFARRAIDPNEGIGPTESDVAVLLLARSFTIPKKALRDGLHVPGGWKRMHDRLRYCTACMRMAYHGVMHQRVGASRCPCHNLILQEQCGACGESAEYRLSAKVLGAPFRCSSCGRPYGGWGARLLPTAPTPKLRRAITRARCGS
jgi:hypothetical protein